MFPIHYTTRSPPSSSPPSSPYPTSSSPPSSPTLDPLALDSDYEPDVFNHASSSSVESLAHFGSGAPMDPLAGSYRPIRAKRASGVACSPGQTPMKKKARFRSKSPLAHRHIMLFTDEDEDEDDMVVPVSPLLDLEKDRQKLLWEEAIERVFETGERKIDLTDQNIDDVPPEVVRDLGKIVVLPQKNEPTTVDDIRAGMASSTIGPASRRAFERTHTAPASTMAGWARHGPNGKAVSSNSILGVSREAMDLFLGKNNIAKLPMELWSLHNLTVLSLRNNSITYIPPEIANLKDLQTLNLAHNKLRFIPSEMLQMKKLTLLNLFPNPFLPQPLPNSQGKYVSKTDLKGPKIPALTELALRILLARPKGTSETMLEQYYELPLATSQDQRPIGAFRDIFSVCVPGSVLPDENRADRKGQWRAFEDEHAARAVTGVGICPNPAHDAQSTFIQPAEERYTWESSSIAIKSLGGNAAVLWRGCMWGCLSFLGVAREEEEERREAAGRSEDDSMDVDLQEGEEVIQTVRFETGTTLDFDD